MLRRRFQSIALTAGILLSTGFALASPSTAGAVTRSYTIGYDCEGSTWDAQSASGSSGDAIEITLSGDGCTRLTVTGVLMSDSEAAVTQWTPSSGWSAYLASTGTEAGLNGSDYVYTLTPEAGNNLTVKVELTGSSLSMPAQIRIGKDNGSGNWASSYHQVSWSSGSAGPSGPSGPSSGSSNTGCEVAGKPCKVRPWPWPVAHTDHINVSWEALIPAEAGTGGVTSYRVESSPAGGTCIL